jgi:hypothetical protein
VFLLNSIWWNEQCAVAFTFGASEISTSNIGIRPISQVKFNARTARRKCGLVPYPEIIA